MSRSLSKKQITFDLRQADLKTYYPRSEHSANPLYYKKAYKDIFQFMKNNGFAWRQGSVYVSKEKLSRSDIFLLTRKMVKDLPWLVRCVKEIDVTDISSKQHSLVGLLIDETIRIEKERTGVSICDVSSIPSMNRKPPLQKKVINARVAHLERVENAKTEQVMRILADEEHVKR